MWFSSCRPMFKHLSESRSVTVNDWWELEHYIESDTLPVSSCDPASSQLSSCLSGLFIFAQPLLKTDCFTKKKKKKVITPKTQKLPPQPKKNQKNQRSFSDSCQCPSFPLKAALLFLESNNTPTGTLRKDVPANSSSDCSEHVQLEMGTVVFLGVLKILSVWSMPAVCPLLAKSTHCLRYHLVL